MEKQNQNKNTNNSQSSTQNQSLNGNDNPNQALSNGAKVLFSDKIKLQVANEIGRAISEILNQTDFDTTTIYNALVEPPNPDMGDMAYGCFVLAKTLKKGPPVIATELAQKLSATTSAVYSSVQAAGPYLNFFIRPEYIGQHLLGPIHTQQYFKTAFTENAPKTMIEFSQPNTHKELHVGHMRNICLGDSIVRLLKYIGVPVISSTFPGDVGTHVAKCLWYLKYVNQEPLPDVVLNAKPLANGKLPAEALIARGEWIGKMYSKGNLKLEDELGTAKEDENRRILTQILHQLEQKQGEFFDLWKETRQWSIDLMKHVYEWTGVEFDQWYWESDVDSDSVKYVKQLFADGKLIESQGAIGMDLTDDKLGFCLLLKTDGTGLYATKDLELAKRKFLNHKIEKSIYIVDVRQALHFQQVFKVLDKLGFQQAKQCYHLPYNFVELPDGAMSSRKGNIVPLIQLVHKMENMVKEKYLVRYQNEWTTDEINLIATQVAKGAIKYGMIRMDNNKKIVFEMEDWLKLDGESGPFIQYSRARIQSLCQKMGYQATNNSVTNNLKTAQGGSNSDSDSDSDKINIDWKLLTHSAERKLMQKMMYFHSTVLTSAVQYRPSMLCTYLYELAKCFNLFYHECSIGQADTPELKQARLALSYSTGQVLEQGLSLLGIPSPLKM